MNTPNLSDPNLLKPENDGAWKAAAGGVLHEVHEDVKVTRKLAESTNGRVDRHDIVIAEIRGALGLAKWLAGAALAAGVVQFVAARL